MGVLHKKNTPPRGAGSEAEWMRFSRPPPDRKEPPIFDYSIKTPEGRLGHLSTLASYDPEQAADYLLFITDRQSTKDERSEEYPVLTANRRGTIDRREVPSSTLAVPGLVSEEDALTYADRGGYSCLPLGPGRPGREPSPQEAEAISSVERQVARARGRRRFLLKRQLISMRRLASSPRNPMRPVPRGADGGDALSLGLGEPSLNPFTLLPEGRRTLCDFDTVRSLLKVRGRLSSADPSSDAFCLLADFDSLLWRAVAASDVPHLARMVRLRLDGYPNKDMPSMLGCRTEQYWASMWANKVPQLVVAQAQRDWLVRHYRDPVAGKWKVCSRCGRRLLAHPMNFSFNTSPDGYYSICKSCRTAQGGDADAEALQ